MLHHHDSGALWNVGDLYDEPVLVHAGGVSILCVPVCADFDLPRHSLHEYQCRRINIGAGYLMATGPVSDSCGSMFGRFGIRYDQT